MQARLFPLFSRNPSGGRKGGSGRSPRDGFASTSTLSAGSGTPPRLSFEAVHSNARDNIAPTPSSVSCRNPHCASPAAGTTRSPAPPGAARERTGRGRERENRILEWRVGSEHAFPVAVVKEAASPAATSQRPARNAIAVPQPGLPQSPAPSLPVATTAPHSLQLVDVDGAANALSEMSLNSRTNSQHAEQTPDDTRGAIPTSGVSAVMRGRGGFGPIIVELVARCFSSGLPAVQRFARNSCDIKAWLCMLLAPAQELRWRRAIEDLGADCGSVPNLLASPDVISWFCECVVRSALRSIGVSEVTINANVWRQSNADLDALNLYKIVYIVRIHIARDNLYIGPLTHLRSMTYLTSVFYL
jgi:hypothetical protein